MTLLIAAVGVANSPKANQLPTTITNSSTDALSLNLRSLQYSMRTYCGIFITIFIISIAYQSLIMVLRLQIVNVSAMNMHFKKFLLVDHIINNICMWLFVGSIVGSYLMGWLWSTYASGTSDQTNNNADTIVSVLMYTAFVSEAYFFITHTSLLSVGIWY